jgi:hypothetical protein
MQETNKIWANGRQLSKYFQIILSVSRTPRPSARQVPTNGSPEAKLLAELLTIAVLEKHKTRQRENAIELLRRELVAGTEKLVGRRQLPNSNAIVEFVPTEFWVGATIRPEEDQATNGATTYDLLRLPEIPAWVQALHNRSLGNRGDFAQSEPQHSAPEESVLSGLPAPAGATSYETDREQAILELYRSVPNFGRLKIERRLDLLREKMSKSAASGFGRSSFYDTVRKLREAGKIPSKNVRK